MVTQNAVQGDRPIVFHRPLHEPVLRSFEISVITSPEPEMSFNTSNVISKRPVRRHVLTEQPSVKAELVRNNLNRLDRHGAQISWDEPERS